MKCFLHQERDAVGICKSCGKGICPDCAVDLGRGLACHGRCEVEVRSLIDLVDRNVRLGPKTEAIMDRASGAWIAGTVFFLGMGALFFGWSMLEARQLTLVGAIGLGFIAYGVFHLVLTLRLARRRQSGK